MGRSDEATEQMNQILDAATVYYTYFVPVHPGRRTVADFLGIRPPHWLSTIVNAHRERELPSSEARMVEEDRSHFMGVLVSSVAKDIIEKGGTTNRGRAVMRIMQELEIGHGRREELKRMETEAYRRSKQDETVRHIQDSVTFGIPDEEDQTPPEIIIPFVTVYEVAKKDRVRALLQTYKGRIVVEFLGKAHRVELEKEGDDDPNTLVAYCYPETGDDADIGTRLGVIRQDRGRLELSSTVEERHKALRDFTAKLVGQKDLHVTSEMRDAIIDPETGEPATAEMLMEERAIEMVNSRDIDQLGTEGLEVCSAAGITSRSEPGASPKVSPRFIMQVLDSYKEKVLAEGRSSSTSFDEAMRRAIFDTTVDYLAATRAEKNLAFETSIAVIAVVGMIIESAEREGARGVARTLRRIIDLEPIPRDAIPLLVRYLERMSRETSRAT